MPAALPPTSPQLYAALVARLQEATVGDALAALARCAALVSAQSANPSAALRLTTDRAAAELRVQMRARAADGPRPESHNGHP